MPMREKKREFGVGAKWMEDGSGVLQTAHRFDRISFNRTVEITSYGCAYRRHCRCAILQIYSVKLPNGIVRRRLKLLTFI
jgi:hypothetical protein